MRKTYQMIDDMRKTYHSCYWCMYQNNRRYINRDDTCLAINNSRDTYLMGEPCGNIYREVAEPGTMQNYIWLLYLYGSNKFWAEMPIFSPGFPHGMEPRLLEILGRTSVCEIGKVGLIHIILVNSCSLGCLCQDKPPNPQSLLSTWPFGGTLSLSSSWPK